MTIMSGNDLAILIPTCCDDSERLHLSHMLSSLAFQEISVGRKQVVVRDEGRYPAMKSEAVRLVWDLLIQKGFDVLYFRSLSRKGIGHARRELFEQHGVGFDFILYVDDDMLLEPGCIGMLIDVLMNDSQAGFAQGSKIELDPSRQYWNDINQLNKEQICPPVPILFGDAALLLARRCALETITWDIISRFSMEGLAGEDVAMTLMMAERYRAWGVPQARGWHLSPSRERWRWEPATDLLQIKILKEVVSSKTLKAALPHLSEKIDGMVTDDDNE